MQVLQIYNTHFIRKRYNTRPILCCALQKWFKDPLHDALHLILLFCSILQHKKKNFFVVHACIIVSYQGLLNPWSYIPQQTVHLVQWTFEKFHLECTVYIIYKYIKQYTHSFATFCDKRRLLCHWPPYRHSPCNIASHPQWCWSLLLGLEEWRIIPPFRRSQGHVESCTESTWCLSLKSLHKI